MKMVKLECTQCGVTFNRQASKHKYAVKRGGVPFCSRKCAGLFRNTRTKVHCCNCDKEVTIGRYRRDSSENCFCSSRCSATFNNKIRGERTEETKKKIGQSLCNYHGSKRSTVEYCVICGKEFRRLSCKSSRKCCSVKCGKIYKNGSLPLLKKDVQEIILTLSDTLERTPQKREVTTKVSSGAVVHFGSWNKAIKACGLIPNQAKISKRCRCKDGHMADSLSELKLDNWLWAQGIRHSRGKRYPGSKMDCDFYLIDYDVWVEYFGLQGFKEYDKQVKRKIKLAKEHELNLIGVKPEDLYPENRLMEVFDFNEK